MLMLLVISIIVLLKCKLVLFNGGGGGAEEQALGIGPAPLCDWDFVTTMFPLLNPATILLHAPNPALG